MREISPETYDEYVDKVAFVERWIDRTSRNAQGCSKAELETHCLKDLLLLYKRVLSSIERIKEVY